MRKNNKKKGFILSYAAVLMAIVLILIVSAIGILSSDVKLFKLEKNKFNNDIKFYQIEEFVITGDFGAAQAETVGTNFTVEIENEGEHYYVTVYEGISVKLYVERYRGQNVKVMYDAKP